MKSKFYKDNKLIYESYKTGCVICGETEKCCLEFHHIGPKRFNISRSLKYINTEELLTELKLTVCVCANCHHKIHNGKISYSQLL